MKVLLSIFAMAAVMLNVNAQSNDPVLMSINGKDVTRSEFEYNYNKNNGESAIESISVEQYVPMFVNYKLKVEAARDARYDTLSSYIKEYRMYRDQLIRPMLVPEADVENHVRAYYEKMKEEIGERGLCHAAHIIISVGQNASQSELSAAKSKIDSIYAAIKDGADFSEMAAKFSQDATAQRGGDLGWFSYPQVIKEFAEVAFSLKDDELSQPIQTAFGWHVLKKLGSKDLEPYEELHDRIKAYLERQNIRERIALVVCDSIARQREVSLDDLMDAECERICKSDIETRYLVQEYREGLLLFEICDREIWQPALEDVKGQQAYFKKNKKKYSWTEPRFAGVVVQAKDEAALAETKALLSKCKDRSKWVDLIKDKLNADSTRVRVEYKLFAKGDNHYVDHQIFGGEKPKFPNRSYPYAQCFGKILKKKAETCYDVEAQVKEDYRRHCEDVWVENLRKRYDVQIDETILKSVNNH